MKVDEVAQRRRQQAAAAQRAEQAARRAGRGTWIAVVSAAVLAGLIGALVASAVVGDARAKRAATGREQLDTANARLLVLRAPVVPDPGPSATGDELVIAAAVARGRADLVAGVVQVPGDPRATPLPAPSTTGRDRDDDEDSTPSSTTSRRAPTRTGPSSLVVVPGPGQPARAVPVPAGPAPAPPAPAPAPPASGRGLLEPCLLGSILC